MIEVWRGCANAWECDHIGHLNTRYYMVKVEQALAAFARLLGLGDVADTAVNGHQLLVKAQHMRFIKEARAGTALHATGQVLRWGQHDADVLFLIQHSISGQMAATFRLTIAYVNRRSGRAEPWPADATATAGTLTAEAPREAQPKSISLETGPVTASMERAQQLSLRTTGFGAVMPDVCDAHGQWRLSGFMGRVADSIPHLRNGEWRDVLARTAKGAGRVGSALVEFQTIHVNWPKVGDLVEVRSGLSGCTERVTYSTHWLLDPATGSPYAAVKTVGIALDLDARKAIALTPQAQDAFRAASVPDLSF